MNYISQRKFFMDLLNDAGFLGCKPAHTLMVFPTKLIKQDGAPLEDATPCRLICW